MSPSDFVSYGIGTALFAFAAVIVVHVIDYLWQEYK